MDILARFRYSQREAAEFKSRFGVELKDYWNPLGFDVIKFDEEFVKPGPSLSCADVIQGRFGVEARQFVTSLITGR